MSKYEKATKEPEFSSRQVATNDEGLSKTNGECPLCQALLWLDVDAYFCCECGYTKPVIWYRREKCRMSEW